MESVVVFFKEKTIPEFCNDLLHFVSTDYDKTTRHKHKKLFKILNMKHSSQKAALNWLNQGKTYYL